MLDSSVVLDLTFASRARGDAEANVKSTTLVPCKGRKFLHYTFVDGTLERYDQLREILHRLPAPVDKLGLVSASGACDIDLGILAGEAQGEPFLPLAAVAPLPGTPGDGARNVVDQPLGDLAELFHGADVGFLIEFALGGLPGILAGINTALRHLPDVGLVHMFDAASAPPDED